MMGHVLDAFLSAFVAVIPGGWRRRGRGVVDPGTGREPDLRPLTIALALSLGLPLVPLGFGLARLVLAAFELAGDPVLVFFGLLFALPAALLAAVLFVLVARAALWIVDGLLARRERAAWFVAAYALGAAGLAVAFLAFGLDGYGWALLGVAVVTAIAALLRSVNAN